MVGYSLKTAFYFVSFDNIRNLRFLPLSVTVSLLILNTLKCFSLRYFRAMLKVSKTLKGFLSGALQVVLIQMRLGTVSLKAEA